MDSEVALVVKAPNQQTDDVRIQANSSWNIAQLKSHLAEVYPTKPRLEEQRIIYSGRLLIDSVVLRDVLRTYEGQEAHTVHLVCAPSRPSPALSQPPINLAQSSEDGVRQRNVTSTPAATQPADAPRPEMRQNDQNHTAEMNYYAYMMSHYGQHANSTHLNYPTTPEQMMMMQNAYMQYMQQYANMWRQAGAESPRPAAAAEAPAAEAAVPEDAEAAAPRDWLDWLYASSRLAILFSLLYFYSSPLRLAVVMILAVAGYLYQLGFLRDGEARLNPNRAPQAPNAAAPAPNAAPHAPNVAPHAPNVAPHVPNVAPQAPNTETVPAEQNSVLSATWMIFTSFFTSLIPDTPNVV